MATRRPQRTRRRTAPAPSLPRPASDASVVAAGAGRAAARSSSRHRAHHVTTDYRYVRKDLVTIAAVGAVCIAFIVGMAIYIGAI